MQLAWLTDIHLNFLDIDERIEFYNVIIKSNPDALLITGDIAEAPSITSILMEMAKIIKRNIYFVLGNHDYYKSKVDRVKSQIISMMQNEKLLHWLPATGPLFLNKDVMLVGQDGWADGRYGNYQNSRVTLLDSRLIEDLFHAKMLGKLQLLDQMQNLADSDAALLQENLIQALKQQPKMIFVLSHVPPFKETCLYEGKISDDDYLPFFGSKISGDVLMEIAAKNTNVDFLVFCGHTHHECYYEPLQNLKVWVGKAEYYEPEIQKIIDI